MQASPLKLGAMYWQNPNYGKKEVAEDMRRIRDNNFNFIRTFIWWEQVEYVEGKFDFSMHDILFEAAAEYDIKVMETFGLYLPAWMVKRLHEQGIDDSNRRYACFDRPEVIGPMQNYIEKVVERYKDAPALAIWNLWNEPCKNACACEHTLAKFVPWLKEKYGTVEQLQTAWLGEHSVFTTIYPESMENLTVEWLQDAFQYGRRGRITPMQYDWLDFSVDNLNDNLSWISNTVRAIDPVHEHHANPCFPIENGYHGGLNEWKMAHHLDSISASVHPSHFFFRVEQVNEFPSAYSFSCDEARSWADGKDAWVGELQAGTTYFHNSKYTATSEDIYHYLWHAYGRGLKGILFWEWQSWRSSMFEVGEFSLRRCHDGGPTERSEAAAEVGAILNEHMDEFLQAELPKRRVAIMVSMASKNFKLLQNIAKSHIEGMDHDHSYAVYGCYKALNRANIAVDFVTEIQIAEGILENYQALFMPHVEVVGPETAGKLRDFVYNGGHLWADGRCGFLDEHIYLRHMIPGNGLDKVFGCEEADFIGKRDEMEVITTDGVALQGHRHIQYLNPTTAETIATCKERPVAIRNQFGQGVAVLYGSYITRGLQEVSADPVTMDMLAQL